MNLVNRLVSAKYSIYIMCVLVLSAVLRLFNLGYSDFQGDEIKALFLPGEQNIAEFLFSQRKGPIQFIVTYLLKFLDPGYTNQLLDRLPFALAGILSVYFFYKLVNYFFNEKIALYSAFFLATNGFFVAFSRIVQYQSFVILFSILALYFFAKAVFEDKYTYNGIYLGSLFWALSILSHYDGIFIAPAVAGLVYYWFKRSKLDTKAKSFKILTAIFIFVFPLALFYVPFVSYLSTSTLAYWEGRLTGDVSSKLSSSYYLFTVYQPIYVVHFYFAMAAVFAIGLVAGVVFHYFGTKLNKFNFISTFVAITNFTYRRNTGLKKIWVVVAWFLCPFIFWEGLVHIPGTHIYTYLLPMFLLLSVGMYYLETLWMNYTSKINFLKSGLIRDVLISAIFLFIALQSYFIFVDNNREYPWQSEKFLIWTFPEPTPIYHLSLFGFPYYRDWEGIGRYISSYPVAGAYSTNERESIARHYIPLKKDTDEAGYYVYIRFPQSFTKELLNEKVIYWANSHEPVYTFSRYGTDLVNIYLMPPGTVEELRIKNL